MGVVVFLAGLGGTSRRQEPRGEEEEQVITRQGERLPGRWAAAAAASRLIRLSHGPGGSDQGGCLEPSEEPAPWAVSQARPPASRWELLSQPHNSVPGSGEPADCVRGRPAAALGVRVRGRGRVPTAQLSGVAGPLSPAWRQPLSGWTSAEGLRAGTCSALSPAWSRSCHVGLT